jgi:rSAM/selenodomain-associated transferase 1
VESSPPKVGTSRPAVAIFARAPVPGKAKTRLIPLLGSLGAAEFQAALIGDTVRKVDGLAGRVSRYVFLTGRKSTLFRAGYKCLRQRGTDLGFRLDKAFRHLLRYHPGAVVIGTDSPLFRPRIIRETFRELRICESVLGPCPDGGFYLVGLRRLTPGLFRGIRWGTRFAFRDTLRNFLQFQYSCSILEACSDVDVPEDVYRLNAELVHNFTARRLAPAVWRYLRSGKVAGRLREHDGVRLLEA